VKNDLNLAFKWWSEAATAIPDAESNVGKMLIEGKGRTLEVQRGYSMVNHAAERGDNGAEK